MIPGPRNRITDVAGLPTQDTAITAALAEAGHRVAHTTVHVHGGVGIDMDHPVHRYFLAAKQTEFAVGGATGQLLRIGRELAESLGVVGALALVSEIDPIGLAVEEE